MLSEVQIFQLKKRVEPTLCGEKVSKSQKYLKIVVDGLRRVPCLGAPQFIAQSTH